MTKMCKKWFSKIGGKTIAQGNKPQILDPAEKLEIKKQTYVYNLTCLPKNFKNKFNIGKATLYVRVN